MWESPKEADPLVGRPRVIDLASRAVGEPPGVRCVGLFLGCPRCDEEELRAALERLLA